MILIWHDNIHGDTPFQFTYKQEQIAVYLHIFFTLLHRNHYWNDAEFTESIRELFRIACDVSQSPAIRAANAAMLLEYRQMAFGYPGEKFTVIHPKFVSVTESLMLQRTAGLVH